MIGLLFLPIIITTPLPINITNFDYTVYLNSGADNDSEEGLALYNLFSKQKLTIPFVKTHIDGLGFYLLDNISGNENLTEDFIREFKDYLHWSTISHDHFLSKEFIIEFADKIKFKELFKNKHISKEVKDYCRMFI